jgi:predicted MFS family arabinose efflux permease
LLVVAGAFTGGGGAVILIPLMVALTDRSTAADRGSAYALYAASFAGALAIGSIGSAPFIDSLGFSALIALGLAGIALAAAVALADRELRISRPHRSERSSVAPPDEASAPIGP